MLPGGNVGVVKQVDTRNLKFPGFGYAGSIPAAHTNRTDLDA